MRTLGLGLHFGGSFGASGAVFATFGALTAAGEGGFPVSGTSVASGDPGGHWQIVGGELTPTGAVSTLDSSYTLVLDNEQEVTVSVASGAATTNNPDELRRYLDTSVTNARNWTAGGTLFTRGGLWDTFTEWSTGTPGPSNPFMKNFFLSCGPTTIRSADLTNRTVMTGFLIQHNTTTISDIDVQDIVFRQAELATNRPHQTLALGRDIFVFGKNCSNCSISDCEIDGLNVPWIDGGVPRESRKGIGMDPTSSGCSATNNWIHNVQTGISIRGANFTFTDNRITHIAGGDWINVSGGDVTGTLTIDRNITGIAIGPNDYRHGDQVQFNDPELVGATVLMRNNRFGLRFGGEVLPGQADGDNLTGELLYVTNSTALKTANPSWTLVGAGDVSASYNITTADVYKDIRCYPLTGTTLTMNLPSAAANDGRQWCFLRSLQASQNTEGTLAFALNGSDTHVATIPPMDGNTDTFTFRSNGTSEWQELRDLKNWMIPQTKDRTLTDLEQFQMIYADSTSQDVVITLPSSPSDGDRFNVKRNHVTANNVTVTGGDILWDGVVSTSLNQTIGQHVKYTYSAANSRWETVQRPATFQGIFSNGQLDDAEIIGNVVVCNAANGLIFEQGMNRCKIVNNTFIRETETGGAYIGGVRLTINGDGNVVMNNVTAGDIQQSGNYDPFDNTELSNEAEAQAFFGVTDFIMATDEDVIQLARPANDNVFHGAYGTSDAQGYLNASTLNVNTANLPAPLLVSSVPTDGYTLGSAEPVVLTFDQPIASGAAAALYVVAGGAPYASSTAVNGRTVTVTPDTAFADATDYGVTTSSILSDVYGTAYAGLSTGDIEFTAELGAITVYTPLNMAAPFTQEFSSTNYQPGNSVNNKHIVFAVWATPSYDPNVRANWMHNDSNNSFEIRTRKNGNFAFEVANVGRLANNIAPPANVRLELYITCDLNASNADDAYTFVFNGVEVDTSTGWDYLTGRSFDPTGDHLSTFLSQQNPGREVTGPFEVLLFDQPDILPDITDPAVRAKMAATVVGNAVVTDNFADTLTARKPQQLIYNNGGVLENFGTATWPSS